MSVVAIVDILCGAGNGTAANGAGMASDGNILLSDRIMRSEPLTNLHTLTVGSVGPSRWKWDLCK